MNALKRTTLTAALLTGLTGVALAANPGQPNPTPPAQSQEQEAQIKRDFTQLDVDKNGNLSTQEVQKDLLLKQKFSDYDIDRNQLLSQMEYRHFAIAQLDPVDFDDEEEAEE